MLAEVSDALAAEDPGKLSGSELKARRHQLRDALDLVASVKLKPAKGRRRDLKAVEVLAERLRDELVDA